MSNLPNHPQRQGANVERGSRGESWSIEGADLLQTLSQMEPLLDARLFQEAHLSNKTYTVFTKNNNFHNTADYKRVLEFAKEEPHRIIANYGSVVGASRSEPIQNVEVIYHSQFTGKVTIQVQVNGAISELLNNYFRNLKEWVTEKLDEVSTASTISTGGSQVIQQGASANTRKEGAISIFDEADELLTRKGARAPRVFISYSHDSDEHKEWVRTLANRLNSLRIWVIFDQYDLKLGSNLAAFMEQGLTESDRVIAICTPNYVLKANNFQGGAGYERTILTQELMESQLGNRVIPLIRNQFGKIKLPTFLSARTYIDFSADEQFDDRLFELSAELLQLDGLRPPFGAANDADGK